MPFVKAIHAVKVYKVDASTLRRWARTGLVRTERTKGKHFLYWIGEDSECDSAEPTCVDESHVIYARVSSKKQGSDLQHQIRYLRDRYPKYSLVTDIGSGINYERTGFKSILERVIRGSVKKVVVANQDRWSRIGYNFFQWLFLQFGAILETVDRPVRAGDDIVGDFMELITVFTARYYGRRKYCHKKSEVEPDEESDTDVQTVLRNSSLDIQ